MLEIAGLTVSLGEKPVLEGVDLVVWPREVLAILGPSGSGKTTLLRAIAGLVPLTRGRICWGGEDVDGVPVHRRGFGLMFQGYALFPHLDVAGNIGFGVPKENRPRAVAAALDWVGLRGFETRDIEGLSGGEKQRVALARTLAPRPHLIMLDEPLGALDRSLRDRLAVDIRKLLEERGVTAIVVTHDRDEAAEMADRIGIMRDGRIIQTGQLGEILANPVDSWVADFIS